MSKDYAVIHSIIKSSEDVTKFFERLDSPELSHDTLTSFLHFGEVISSLIVQWKRAFKNGKGRMQPCLEFPHCKLGASKCEKLHPSSKRMDANDKDGQYFFSKNPFNMYLNICYILKNVSQQIRHRLVDAIIKYSEELDKDPKATVCSNRKCKDMSDIHKKRFHHLYSDPLKFEKVKFEKKEDFQGSESAFKTSLTVKRRPIIATVATSKLNALLREDIEFNQESIERQKELQELHGHIDEDDEKYTLSPPRNPRKRSQSFEIKVKQIKKDERNCFIKEKTDFMPVQSGSLDSPRFIHTGKSSSDLNKPWRNTKDIIYNSSKQKLERNISDSDKSEECKMSNSLTRCSSPTSKEIGLQFKFDDDHQRDSQFSPSVKLQSALFNSGGCDASEFLDPRYETPIFDLRYETPVKTIYINT